jgi:hypothetical protein
VEHAGATNENRLRAGSTGSSSSETGFQAVSVGHLNNTDANVEVVGLKRKADFEGTSSHTDPQGQEQGHVAQLSLNANTDTIVETFAAIPTVLITEDESSPTEAKGVYKNYKFKTLGVFKDKDEFMELLMGHSYSNKYSCYHNAVHQCMIHEEIDGTACSHQFRICEKSDALSNKTFELQERGEHSTSLKMDLLRGVHPLMVIDVDEMLMSGVTPSQIIKALRAKYDGQTDMMSLIPKKTKIVSRKITARVKGPQKRSSFAYTPPVCTTPYIPAAKTPAEIQQQQLQYEAQLNQQMQLEQQQHKMYQYQHHLKMMNPQQQHRQQQQQQSMHLLQQGGGAGGISTIYSAQASAQHLLNHNNPSNTNVQDVNSNANAFHDSKNYAVMSGSNSGGPHVSQLQSLLHRGGAAGDDSSDSSDDDEGVVLKTQHPVIPVYVGGGGGGGGGGGSSLTTSSASLPIENESTVQLQSQLLPQPPLSSSMPTHFTQSIQQQQGIVATANAAALQKRALETSAGSETMIQQTPSALESVLGVTIRGENEAETVAGQTMV